MGADIEFVLVVAGGHDLNDECMFEVNEFESMHCT